jgi:hypothetical protein
MNQYHSFHLELLKQTYNQLITHSPFNQEELMPQEQTFLDSFALLIEQCETFSAQYIENGQAFCISWIRSYSELNPLLPRDLLWFFSGDCLHYMPDEEISVFQRLDELRFEAESSGATFDYPLERAKIFNLIH